MTLPRLDRELREMLRSNLDRYHARHPERVDRPSLRLSRATSYGSRDATDALLLMDYPSTRPPGIISGSAWSVGAHVIVRLADQGGFPVRVSRPLPQLQHGNRDARVLPSRRGEQWRLTSPSTILRLQTRSS